MKLNVRWLAGILIGTAALSGVIYLVHEYQMHRNAVVFLREAKRVKAENKLDEAANFLGRYLALAPNDLEGQVMFGQVLFDLGRFSPAYLTLDKIIQRHPERDDVRRPLALAAQKIGKFSEAIGHLQNHLLKDEGSKDAVLFARLGECQVATKDFLDAARSFRKSIDSDPQQLDTYLQLAFLRREKLNQPKDADDLKGEKDADSLMNDMVKANEENYRAYLNRAQWWLKCLNDLRDLTRAPEARSDKDLRELRGLFETDVQKAIKMAPDDAIAIGLSAQVALDNAKREDGKVNVDKVEEARQLLTRAIELFPSEPRSYFQLAELESQFGKAASAIDALRRGSKAVPKERHFKWTLATLLIDAEKFDEVTELIKQLRSEKHPEPLIGYLEGQMKVRRGDWSGAIKLLESIRPRLNDSQRLLRQLDLWVGIAYRELGLQDQQLTSLHRSVADDRNWIPARMALAESMLAANQTREAAEEYRVAMTLSGAPLSARAGYVRCLLLANLRQPSEKQDWREFDEQLKQLGQLEGSSSTVAIFRMEQLIAQKNIDEAERVITTARDKEPAITELWIAQISLAQLSQKWDEIDSLIQSAIDRFGDTPSFRLIKVRMIAQRLGKEGVDQLRPLILPNPTWSAQQTLQFSTNVAPLLLSVGEADEAGRQVALVAKAEPNNVRIRLLQLDMALQSQKPEQKSEQMKPVLDELARLTSKGAIWQYGNAVRLMLDAFEVKDPESKDQYYKDALESLKEAKKLRPTWGKVPGLVGEIQETRGDSVEAINQYLDAIRLGEKGQNVAVRALRLLLDAKRFNEADKLLRQMHESQGLFSEGLSRAEVAISLELGRKDDAKKAVEQLVKNSPQAQDPLWLGQVYATLENLPEAEQQFRLALKSHPENSRVLIALVQVLIASKKADEAEQVINEAKSVNTEDQSLIAIARCYELLGKADHARASYLAAVEKHPDDLEANQNWIEYQLKTGAIADAVAALRKLLATTTGADTESQIAEAWCRRRLALALMSLGQREGLVEALGLINRNLEKSQTLIEDLRTQALILISLGEREQQRKAISSLEKVVQNAPAGTNVSEDRFLLARLYSSNRDLDKARSELKKLFEIKNDDPRYLSLYIQLLLEEKNNSDADLYVSKLKKVAPNDLATTELETRVLYARQRFDEIVAVLKAVPIRAASAQEKPEAIAGKKLWTAKKFEEFARAFASAGEKLTSSEDKPQAAKYNVEAERFNKEAERLYSQISMDKAEEMLALGEFLARGPQIDRALDLLEEHGAASQPIRIASFVFALMKNEKATPAQLTRLQDLLQKNEESRDRPVLLTLVSADLLNWRGKPEDAVKNYREVLRRDGKNVAALNNLAVLIAFTGGDINEAGQLVQKAISISGPKASLIDSRGLVHLAGGRPEKAIDDFRLAIVENENGERLFHSALALAELKLLVDAKKALDKARELGLAEVDLHPLERAKYAKLVEQLTSVEI